MLDEFFLMLIGSTFYSFELKSLSIYAIALLKKFEFFYIFSN
jgi:hypothetical protein